MTLEPLFQASPAIQVHAFSAVAAFGLGAVVLFRRKGGFVHRLLGRIWVALMVVVALSSFFIHTIRVWGSWSPIHILSIAALLALAHGVAMIRRRNVRAHRRIMQSTFLGTLVVAGLFTLLPGRIMNAVLFGPAPATQATAAGEGGPGPIGVIGGTPLWVWPLLAWVLYTGWSRMRDRVLAPWRLMLMPAVIAAFAVFNLAAAKLGVATLAGFACGAIAGFLPGFAIALRRPAERLAGGMLKVRGDWVPLALAIGIFAVRYAQGVTRALDPALAAGAAFTAGSAFLSGLFAAVMIARTVGQLLPEDLRSLAPRLAR